ncbi:MAG: topoisomerase C-terminal repeat-containing protein [Clostridia bacterium]|nr:topoisomerase C-terminal repeat-containing protein [Clostridia bacterium]
MILIIAEKPSLARNIVAGIGKMDRKDGYFIGEGYIVSWAFGHLFSLADIEHYNPTPDGSAKWTMENLPCFPEKFHFELRKGDDKKPDNGVIRQFGVLEYLCNREDVEAIVNAGDADREGEIIVRLCISHALKAPKKQLRLWLPDQTPETVRAALADMKEEAAYDLLANEGFARTYIDWLYGVNLTRFATIRAGTLLRVGRVIVPIVRAIYDRDMEIRNFSPETYYMLRSREQNAGEVLELWGKNKFSKDEIEKCRALAEAYNAAGATVTAVKNKQDRIPAGKLYSLSALQNVLGKKYKMSMAESLEIVQKLYEEGYLTYPRTNSEYLATAEKDKIRAILSGVAKLGYPVKFKDSKNIFDDSKIESHSALTPTYKIPDTAKLSEKQKQVYGTVMRRFVAVFCAEECLADKSEIRIAVGDLEEFVLKGTVIRQAGWTKYDDYSQKDKILPALSEGDRVNIRFEPAERQTTPPKHYTIETLNNYLKNPFKDDKAKAKELEQSGEVDDAEDYKAIFEGLELGTEATRTGIIDNARKSGYIELKKDVYSILPGGERLIHSLERLGIRMDKYKTSEMGKALKSVYRGTMTVDESVALAKGEIGRIFAEGKKNELPPEDTGKLGEIMGRCPRCGANVIRGNRAYGCMGYKDGCDFKVGLAICARAIPKSAVQSLLATGKTPKLRGFISKTGRPFDAALVIRDGEAVFDFAKPKDPAKEKNKKSDGEEKKLARAKRKPKKTEEKEA